MCAPVRHLQLHVLARGYTAFVCVCYAPQSRSPQYPRHVHVQVGWWKHRVRVKHRCRHFAPRMPPSIVYARAVAPQPRRPTPSGAETAFPSRVGYLY